MKKLYFDVNNGKVIRPRDITTPEYYVTLNEKDKVQEFYTCFSRVKIQQMGNEWLKAQLTIDKIVWSSYTWLINSLVQYIREYSYLTEKQNYEEEYKDHYVYLLCKST
ncbi:hypothetical protein D3C74_299980 [compost metagenome]